MASTIQSVKEGKLSKNSSDDRISNLPKPVLLHILSFLSTKEAAATSVLSKPWQHLWTWVPDLDISDFVAHDTRSFIRVIFRIFLSRREWCIRKLVLSFHLYCDVVTLHNILCTAVERNVEEIHLFLGCCALLDEVFELPHSLFSCKTLMVLRLEGEIAINLGCSFHLPSLEVLHLNMVRYKDEDTFSNLLAACPVLEELLLHLSDMVTDNCLHYEISSHTIKYLALGFYGFSARSLSNVTVDAPALKHFTIDNGSGPNVLLSNDSTEIKELEDEFAILKEKYRRVRKKTKKNTALLKLMYQQLRNTNPDMPAFESSSDSDS